MLEHVKLRINGKTKTKLVMLAFLFCNVFVENSVGD